MRVSVAVGPSGLRRGLYWAAVLVALVAVVVGAVVAYLGYTGTSGPAGTVRGYFAALQRGDAAAALAFGDLPRGPHALLTDTVLREQRRIAPISHVQVVTTSQDGGAATVTVGYDLGFAAGVRHVTDQVPVRRAGDSWRLTATAVPATIDLDHALDRATIVGSGIPDGRTLLFPGAVPISLDTPYLRVTGGVATFGTAMSGTGDRVEVTVAVSPAGRDAVAKALQASLDACLKAGGAGRCPLPSDRFVPGSLRGTLIGKAADDVSLTVAADPAGVIDVSGTIGFRGSFRLLDFDNVASRHTGTIQLPLSAVAYAVPPVRLRWTAAS